MDVFLVTAEFEVVTASPEKAAAAVAAKLGKLKEALEVMASLGNAGRLPAGGVLGAPWDSVTGPGWKCHFKIDKAKD